MIFRIVVILVMCVLIVSAFAIVPMNITANSSIRGDLNLYSTLMASSSLGGMESNAPGKRKSVSHPMNEAVHLDKKHKYKPGTNAMDFTFCRLGRHDGIHLNDFEQSREQFPWCVNPLAVYNLDMESFIPASERDSAPAAVALRLIRFHPENAMKHRGVIMLNEAASKQDDPIACMMIAQSLIWGIPGHAQVNIPQSRAYMRKAMRSNRLSWSTKAAMVLVLIYAQNPFVQMIGCILYHEAIATDATTVSFIGRILLLLSSNGAGPTAYDHGLKLIHYAARLGDLDAVNEIFRLDA